MSKRVPAVAESYHSIWTSLSGSAGAKVLVKTEKVTISGPHIIVGTIGLGLVILGILISVKSVMFITGSPKEPPNSTM